jgi:hypothetical protein
MEENSMKKYRYIIIEGGKVTNHQIADKLPKGAIEVTEDWDGYVGIFEKDLNKKNKYKVKKIILTDEK